MTRTWTPAQRQAIETTGTNILVAASAGSGKTAVLIERIVEHVCRGVPIERLLVVTFTAAAAEEMRHRLRHALAARAAQGYDVQDERTRLPLAHVMTVHAFCQHVVRTYAAEAGIDPSVRLAQTTEQMLLRQEACEAVLEHHYKTMPADDPFWQFVLHYGGQTSDEAIVDYMEQLFHLAWSQPFPEQWLEQLSVHCGDDRMIPLERMALAKMHDWQQRLIDLQARATEQLEPLREAIEADLAIVQRWIDALLQGWVPFTEQLCAPQFARAKPVKDVSDPEAKKAWTKQREAIKKDMKNLWKRVRVCMDTDHDPTTAWIRLVRAYHKEYCARKKAKKLIDFQDLEHMCLRVLGTPSEPSAIAIELQAQYVEVMVDEYQDTNAVQEAILQCVSQKNNRFMVGDVKQSIYRFRLAQPELFMEKATTYDTRNGIRIDLTDNFRSRDAVISFVNAVFSTMMDRQFAEIPYDTAARMTASASYPPLDRQSTVPELVLLDRTAHEEEEEHTDEQSEPEQDASDEADVECFHVDIEGQWIAHRIAQAISGAQPIFVSEQSEVRTAQYRDIAILVRNNSWIPRLLDVLRAWGIPAHGEVRQGFFASTEGRTMLALLQAIDNPYQDIPLVALLRSPIGQFSDDDLVWVRQKQEGPFFDALRSIAQDTSTLANRVRTWLERFDEWRICARQQSVATLLRTVLRASAYDVHVGGLADGARRQANIQSLIDRARMHEQAAMPGLFSFLRMLEQLQQQGQDLPTALSEQEDVVRVMTVHKSKGLEFPVVIVAGMGVQFSQRDARQPLLLHKTALAAQTVNMDTATIVPTMRWWALQTLKKQEQWAEELRVLYVALTRAREKLILCGSSARAEAMWSQWQRDAQTPQMTAGQFWDARTWLDWIVPACLRCPHTDPPLWHRMSATVPPRPSIQDRPEQPLIGTRPQDDRLEQTITERLTFAHPHRLLQHIAAKRAVSDVLALEHSEKRQETAVPQRRWRSMRSTIDRPLSAAERGRAIHAVMEFIPLHELPTMQRLRTWMTEWVASERLTEQQADAVPLEAIIQFWHQPIGQRIQQSSHVYRELPFSLMVPLSRWYPEVPHAQEHILVQGVIDCLCWTGTGWMLIDYKTESTRHKTDDALREKFTPQIKLYTEGVETALHDRVEEQVLYFFDGGRTVTIA